MEWPVHNLNFCKSVMIELALSKWQNKSRSYGKKLSHLHRITFAISTYVAIEEMASAK